MALKMPPADHPVRELIRDTEFAKLTIEHVLTLPTLTQARHRSRRWFRDGRRQPGDLYHTLVLRADGAIVLKSFGAKGGNRTRWNFGRWESPPEVVA